MCKQLYFSKVTIVHVLEKVLGTMESVRPSTPLAALHYRSLQRQLLKAKCGGRRPSQSVYVNVKSLHELKWWCSDSGFPSNCTAPLRELEPTIHIWTDSNMERGGACSSRGDFYQRSWEDNDLQDDPHIAFLETRSAKEGVLALANVGDRVRLHIDNVAACAYIRRQGGTKSSILSTEACSLWQEAFKKNITILTPHWLSSKDNASADFLSRNDLDQWEFGLSAKVFGWVLETFSLKPTLDAFASAESARLPRYMTWFPDSNAVAQDALLNDWDPISYLFPPVPLILKVLNRVKEQQIRAILICPWWPTAVWWTLVEEMLVVPPLRLPHFKEILLKAKGAPVLPYLEPLVAVHILGSSSPSPTPIQD